MLARAGLVCGFCSTSGCGNCPRRSPSPDCDLVCGIPIPSGRFVETPPVGGVFFYIAHSRGDHRLSSQRPNTCWCKTCEPPTGGQDAGSELDLLSTFAGTHDATEWCYSGQLAQHTPTPLTQRPWSFAAWPAPLRLAHHNVSPSGLGLRCVEFSTTTARVTDGRQIYNSTKSARSQNLESSPSLTVMHQFCGIFFEVGLHVGRHHQTHSVMVCTRDLLRPSSTANGFRFAR